MAAVAQELPPGGDDWNLPPIGAEPAADETQQKEGWLVDSPLMKIGWPEMKFPKLLRNGETGEPGLLTKPLVRAQSATRAVATRTRDSWNGAVDRVKLSLPGGNSGEDMGKQLSENEPRQRFWSSWFGAAKPDEADELGPDSVPDMMARDPKTTVR